MKRSRKKSVFALAAALAIVASGAPDALAQVPGGTLDLGDVPQFTEPLIIPPVMPAAGLRWDAAARKLVPYYEIEVVQFQQQILPPGFPATTVWSYGAVGRPETRNYPAFTIESWKNVPTRVKWVNNLVDEHGNHLPHLLPVDQTIHWANPPGGPGGQDSRGTDQAPYTGPVPIVTHVHGAHVQPDSDGYPEAWYLPAANDIPGSYATRGSHFGQIPGAPDEAGAALFQYRNDQPPTTLWYHDHTLGMTRANVYAGPAGFYLIRDLASSTLGLPGPAPLPGLDPNGNALVRRLTREIPIVIQDRSFDADGSLFYPDNRDFFEGLDPGSLTSIGISFSPTNGSDIAPIWNPEFFGNTMVVNGRTWPKLDVERRKYRFRLLNGSNSRFLILRFEGERLAFQQIGADQGFLPAPVTLRRLLLAPAERADVVVDFSSVRAGTRIVLENVGPDEPFGGGEPCIDTGGIVVPGCDFLAADPSTTGVVMAFDVVPRTGPDLSRIPKALPAEGPLPASDRVRKVSLNEMMSMNQVACFDEEGNLVLDDAPPCESPNHEEEFGPASALLGSIDEMGMNMHHHWSDAVTENPALGSTETWKIYNFTEDAHPIHPHLTRLKVVARQSIDDEAAGVSLADCGADCAPEPWEAGYKDTLIAYPGQVTTFQARFDIAGLYVWHCHIIEHEDNEMMRPYCVGGQETCPVPIAPSMPMHHMH
jgi:FtsP/CotA-like multicopper oxidase with cupredoxin domain